MIVKNGIARFTDDKLYNPNNFVNVETRQNARFIKTKSNTTNKVGMRCLYCERHSFKDDKRHVRTQNHECLAYQKKPSYSYEGVSENSAQEDGGQIQENDKKIMHII